jgi:hypothetical protein
MDPTSTVRMTAKGDQTTVMAMMDQRGGSFSGIAAVSQTVISGGANSSRHLPRAPHSVSHLTRRRHTSTPRLTLR